MPSGQYVRRKLVPPTREELQQALNAFRFDPLNMDARLMAFEALRRIRSRIAQRAVKMMTQAPPSVELDSYVCSLLENELAHV
jgi:hypothetical protein